MQRLGTYQKMGLLEKQNMTRQDYTRGGGRKSQWGGALRVKKYSKSFGPLQSYVVQEQF